MLQINSSDCFFSVVCPSMWVFRVCLFAKYLEQILQSALSAKGSIRSFVSSLSILIWLPIIKAALFVGAKCSFLTCCFSSPKVSISSIFTSDISSETPWMPSSKASSDSLCSRSLPSTRAAKRPLRRERGFLKKGKNKSNLKPEESLRARKWDGWLRPSLCLESGKEGAEKGEQVGLDLNLQLLCLSLVLVFVLVWTWKIPPSLVRKEHEGSSREIASR